MKELFLTALLSATLLGHAAPSVAQTAADERRRVKALARVVESGAYQEAAAAIGKLARPRSGEAAKYLLKRLKHNLSRKRGNVGPPWSSYTDGELLWGSYASENALLAAALAEQGHAPAVPTLRRMLGMDQGQSGDLRANLARHIHQLTGETVEYEEWGMRRTYPEPGPKP